MRINYLAQGHYCRAESRTRCHFSSSLFFIFLCQLLPEIPPIHTAHPFYTQGHPLSLRALRVNPMYEVSLEATPLPVENQCIYPQFRARRVLSLVSDIPRRALSLYKVYGVSTLLVLNLTSLNSDNALLVLSRRYTVCVYAR